MKRSSSVTSSSYVIPRIIPSEPLRPAGTIASCDRGRSALRDLLTDAPDRRTATPVGSDAWLRPLGEGGAEDYGEALS